MENIIKKHKENLSPWVDLITKYVREKERKEVQLYHSLKPKDYVSALVVRSDGLIPIVRQFRPGIESFTYELPGGLLDEEVSPEEIIVKEVFEETGHKSKNPPILLGNLYTDPVRLENKFWAFFLNVEDQIDNNWQAEPDVEMSLVSKKELERMVLSGNFSDATHLGLINLAILKGLFSWK